MQSARINQWGTFALKRGKVNLKYVIVNKRLANRPAIQARCLYLFVHYYNCFCYFSRATLMECVKSCVGGKMCQKRQYPPLYPFNTGGKGWGLKSNVEIKKGDFVIEYVGELIDEEEFRRRLKAKQDAGDETYHFMTLDGQRMIDAGSRGNLARFMNHSCHPNCETETWKVDGDYRIGLFAVEDIPANTELTINYLKLS